MFDKYLISFTDEGNILISNHLANGEEDLREKNKDHKKPNRGHYSSWENHYGREDAEMLYEKSKQGGDDDDNN